MWWIVEYEAVTLFSLKMSSATASGGKTLLVPTPYALKMALLDVACRLHGIQIAKSIWPQLRNLQVALRPAEHAIVTNLFQKVLRPRRNPVPFDQADSGPFQKTIGYREYAYLSGHLGLAFGLPEDKEFPLLPGLLLHINYLGKRGGFMQLRTFPYPTAELPGGYLVVTVEQTTFPVDGTLQLLDDCSPELDFDKANIYSRLPVKLGKERVIRNIVIPYRPICSSRSFTLYHRLDI